MLNYYKVVMYVTKVILLLLYTHTLIIAQDWAKCIREPNIYGRFIYRFPPSFFKSSSTPST